ncbi:AMP-binding protein [Roseinatronobacter sp. S2]|uniref:AMP-binding protein n=1 Tax=Roseinatronobacter sp. S2 TaxID=3035471 RepID=UPI00240F4BA9|nr:AMP-binding protein [Roseinatronobacter sp. S2]WFE76914.1 AMP-binding protein [Roseinatronobacter sp. S2]
MGFAPDMAAKRAELTPDALAFLDHSTGRNWTFAQVNAEAAAVAGGLLGLGLEQGARVAILCHNRAEFFIALFACQKAGLILCPLNWRQPDAELRPLLASVGCSAILHDAAHATLAQALSDGQPCIGFAAQGGFDLHGPPPPPRQIDDDAPWYLLFTSGTTGLPKAVIQTPRMAMGNAVNIAQHLGLSSHDSTACFLPLFHTAGINLFTLPVFLWGGHSHVLAKFQPDDLFDLIATGRISHFFGVPAIYQAFSLHPAIDDVDLTRLRSYACGGAALPAEVIRFFADRGAVICNGYGMTETGPTGFLLDPAAALARIGSIGKPQTMTEARLSGVPDGQPGEGELEMRGATVTPGYFGDPDATASAFTPDGWLKSGDVAARDAAGYYTIIDRIKDMYISGGENVYPAEVERVLITHPAILEAAVIGIPHPKWGEVGAAFIIARPGHDCDTDTLTDWCRARLAGYKTPKSFHLIDDFPRTAAGKVRKPLLRKMLP